MTPAERTEDAARTRDELFAVWVATVTVIVGSFAYGGLLLVLGRLLGVNQ